ncbi:MAG: hypothetical protein AAFY05_24035, partial [Pseudomonadota bacterium]
MQKSSSKMRFQIVFGYLASSVLETLFALCETPGSQIDLLSSFSRAEEPETKTITCARNVVQARVEWGRVVGRVFRAASIWPERRHSCRDRSQAPVMLFCLRWTAEISIVSQTSAAVSGS